MSRFTFQGGVQYRRQFAYTFPRLGSVTFRPFGHVLAGMHRQSLTIHNADPETFARVLEVYGTDTIKTDGFALTFGGGLDIPVWKRLDVRVFQFNYSVLSIPAQLLAESTTFINTPYETAITGSTLSQITIAFGVVFR